jgi:hypothetical protein
MMLQLLLQVNYKLKLTTKYLHLIVTNMTTTHGLPR